jgi:hypothetical protein
MLTPSPEILPGFAVFAPLMSAPTFYHAFTLLCGAILTPGARTVAAALRTLGRTTGNFSKYHHFFSRAHWSPGCASQRLLHLLMGAFLPPDAPIIVLADEHLERRKGAHVAFRGLFRDPTHSTHRHTVYTWGIRWLVLALLVPVPWSSRPWALPFFVFPLRSEKVCARLGKPHRSVVAWLARLVVRLRRWVPDRVLVLVGDGTYAALELAHACRNLAHPIRLVSRLRWNAALYDFPAPQPPSKRGPKPKKGKPQPTFAARLTDPKTVWKKVTVTWYGHGPQTVEIATGVSLWHRSPHPVLPIRWVLVRSPAGAKQPITPGVCFCTDPDVAAVQILSWYLGRWNIEVTFAEIRAHLGLETQRHWCPRSVTRLVPCLFGVFSLVVLWAKELFPHTLPLPQTAWYTKAEATFGDALAGVRQQFWQSQLPPPPPNYLRSGPAAAIRIIPAALWAQVEQLLCYAA